MLQQQAQEHWLLYQAAYAAGYALPYKAISAVIFFIQQVGSII